MKNILILIATTMISIIATGLLFHLLGYRINLTESIPVGLYRISVMELKKNALVIFCPEDRWSFRLAKNRGYLGYGFCKKGYGYLMKQVVATSGDLLSVTDKGVYVNRILLPYSKPRVKDGLNRTLPRLRIMNYKLQINEIMTMTNQSDWSFDGRYYGLVHTSQIKGMITPLWVVKKVRRHES